MGAFVTPHRFPRIEVYIVHRTFLNALTAAGAGVISKECCCLHKKAIKNRVHNSTHETVIQFVLRDVKSLPGLNTCSSLLNVRLCFLCYFPCLICVGGIEHGDIILRHDDPCGTHIFNFLLVGNFTVVFSSIPDSVTAIHYKPNPFCTGQFRL